jgi:hypothetical protein
MSCAAELEKECRENTNVVFTVCSFFSRLLYLFNDKGKGICLNGSLNDRRPQVLSLIWMNQKLDDMYLIYHCDNLVVVF